MNMPKRILFKFWEHLINALANGLPDDHFSSRLRPFLYRGLGNRVSARARIFGGGRVCGKGLVVEDDVFINRSCYFDLTHSIELRSGSTIGHGVTFVTANHRIGPSEKRAGDVYSAPVTVGPGAWIGANATILPGVTVGAGSIVGAGALVTKSVPPNCLVIGVPARVARSLLDG